MCVILLSKWLEYAAEDGAEVIVGRFDQQRLKNKLDLLSCDADLLFCSAKNGLEAVVIVARKGFEDGNSA